MDALTKQVGSLCWTFKQAETVELEKIHKLDELIQLVKMARFAKNGSSEENAQRCWVVLTK